MPPVKLDTIDDFEDHLTQTLEAWPAERRTAFAAAMADRWLPVYDAFAEREQWGDVKSLRNAIDAAWAHVCGRHLTPGDRARHLGLVRESIPHMDDFDDAAALAAAVMVQEAVDSCTADNVGAAFQAGLSGFEAVVPDWSLDPDEQPRLWQRGPVRKEMTKQLKLLERIAEIPSFDDASVKAFRRELGQKALAGELPRQKAPAAPPLRTNQDVFEQYRAIIESEIRNRRDWTPPDELGPVSIASLWFMEWLGRYKRRMDLASGAYGKLADAVGQVALVRRQQARDAAVQAEPQWDAELRRVVDRILANPVMTLDVRSVAAPHGYGPSVRRLWAEAERAGKSGAECWQHVVAWARHRPAVWDEEDRRKKRGKAMAAPALATHLAREVSWTASPDAMAPWTASVDGARWQVRINDYPDEIMYSLIIDDAVIGDFHDWPERWLR